MSSFPSSPKGFSLIEIMVSITIFLVLSTMVAISFRSTQAESDLRDAKALIISHVEALRSDARSGRVAGAGTPASYLIGFASGEGSFSEAIDVGGCGGPAEVYASTQLPKGVVVSPAFGGSFGVAFYVPTGEMVIDPSCPPDRVCVAPCDAGDVAASDINITLQLEHESGKSADITFDMIRGVVE